MAVVDLSQVERREVTEDMPDYANIDSKDETDFDALSYTWGSPFSTSELSVLYTQDFDARVNVVTTTGRYQISIRRNLYEALCQFWEAGARRYLWVDALCIDQDDLEEKASQVQLMAEIYSKASAVIVWFGVDDPDQSTFKQVEWLVERFEEITDYETEQGIPIEIDMQLGPRNEALGLKISGLDSDLPADALRALFRFLVRRRYLSRAWIAQEIALSTTCVALMGDHFLAMEKLMGLMMRLDRHQTKLVSFHQFESDQSTSGIGIELIGLYTMWARACWWNDREIESNRIFLGYVREVIGPLDENSTYLALLLAHLSTGHARSCTNPVDAIYSLLGYLTRLAPLTKYPIEVDYQRSVEDVYTAVTATFLRVLPHYSVLSSICDLDLDEMTSEEDYTNRLPSWVPDFNRCRKVDTIECMALHALNKSIVGIDEETPHVFPRFRAGVDGSSPRPPVFRDKELLIYARRCSKVVSTHRPGIQPTVNRLFEDTLMDWFNVCLPLLKMSIACKEATRTGCTVIESLFRVIFVPSPLLGCKLNQEFGELIVANIMMQLFQAIGLFRNWKNQDKDCPYGALMQEMLSLLNELEGQPCLPSKKHIMLLDQWSKFKSGQKMEKADLQYLDMLPQPC